MRTVVRVCLVACLSLQVLAVTSGLQQGRKQPPPVSVTPSSAPLPTTNIRDGQVEEAASLPSERARLVYNRERQAELMADSRRLTQLSTELEDEIERAGDGSLSVTLLKKADEIIKLAKSVKVKMRRD